MAHDVDAIIRQERLNAVVRFKTMTLVEAARRFVNSEKTSKDLNASTLFVELKEAVAALDVGAVSDN